MQCPISDEAAIAFSRAFYQRLSVDPVDAAVAEGRQAVYSRNTAGFEWATPVLFMRTPNGEIFPQEDIPPSRSPGQLARREEGMLPEVKINFVGLWKGSRENLVTSKKGEEVVNIEWQKDGEMGDYFFDTSEDSFIIEFEAEFRGGNLFVSYRAREGEMIMQVGSCCLRLRDNRTLEGHYADFSGCGTYELKLIGYTGAALPARPAQLT